MALYFFAYSFEKLFPWGALLGMSYWFIFSKFHEITFSYHRERKSDLYLTFMLTYFALFQFAKTNEIFWWAQSVWPILFLQNMACFDEAKLLREKKIHLALIGIHAISFPAIVFFSTLQWAQVFSAITLELMFFLPGIVLMGKYEEKRFLRFKNRNLRLVESAEIDSKKEQKFFYHDLINKTHGIHLFLSEKIRKKDMREDDLILLQKEIFSLQTIIKDHSEINHRNLKPVREYVSYYEVRAKIQYMLKTYFSHSEVVFVENYSKNNGTINDFLVHAVCFERMIGNLFKNAYEAHTSRIELTINVNVSELIFEMKNNFKTLPENSFQMAERLSRNILSHGNEDAPLGIESVHFLVERMEGVFKFGIEDGLWVSRVVIPNRKTDSFARVKKAVNG